MFKITLKQKLTLIKKRTYINKDLNKHALQRIDIKVWIWFEQQTPSYLIFRIGTHTMTHVLYWNVTLLFSLCYSAIYLCHWWSFIFFAHKGSKQPCCSNGQNKWIIIKNLRKSWQMWFEEEMIAAWLKEIFAITCCMQCQWVSISLLFTVREVLLNFI